MRLGVGVPSRATEEARELKLRDGVAGATELAREMEGVLVGSGGAGGRMDQPKRAVKTAVSEGSTRGIEVVEALEIDSSDGVDGSTPSKIEDDDGNDTDEMMEYNDWT